MKLLHVIVTNLCILKIVCQIPDVVEETEEPSVTGDNENTELDSGPVTEQVMEPNITMNKPGDPETEEISDDEMSDPSWNVNLAVRDLAYFLRAHKFLDYDRRYFKSANEATSLLYKEFPRPALRSLHWEVHKNCDIGFNSCLRYLDGIVRMTSLRRDDDTVTIMRVNKWNANNNSQQVIAAQKDCEVAQKRDNRTVIPFQGPIGKIVHAESWLILSKLDK